MEQNGITTAIIANSTNPAVEAYSQQITDLEGKLQQLLNEIGSTSSHLKSLRQHEAQLEFNVQNTRSKLQALTNNQEKQQTTQISNAIQEEENAMRKLQSQISNLNASREFKLGELGKINSMGHNADNSRGAGAQQRTNVDISRYDLEVPEVATGLSHDPLAQTPMKGALGSNFGGATEGFAPGIDNIGNHISASPFVKPQDYTVVGDRPQTANVSAKFREWHSPSRSAQPPGGHSHMQSIFG